MIRKDPSDIFSQNMYDLINVVMPIMCTKNNPHPVKKVEVEAHQDKQAVILFRMLSRVYEKSWM